MWILEWLRKLINPTVDDLNEKIDECNQQLVELRGNRRAILRDGQRFTVKYDLVEEDISEVNEKIRKLTNQRDAIESAP